jgi:dipeptidyl aminopeptidase/acylaminoacyl peptidase
VPIAENVGISLGHGYFSASANGILAFRHGTTNGAEFLLKWFDRSGKDLGSVGEPGNYNALALSPDGTRVVAGRDISGIRDLWTVDLNRNTTTRLTTDPVVHVYDYPVWSPDGNEVVFASNLFGFKLERIAGSGAGKQDLLARTDTAMMPLDWSRDGRFLLYAIRHPRTKSDIWVLPMDGSGKPTPFLQSQFSEESAQFSPDTHWVAYTSDESGKSEIYVRPFPEASSGVGKIKISEGGGGYPRWRRDGKELFYISSDQKLMAVEVSTMPTFKAGLPKALFGTRMRPGNQTHRWDVSADGKRFLIDTIQAEDAEAPITVVTNWTAGLNK